MNLQEAINFVPTRIRTNIEGLNNFLDCYDDWKIWLEDKCLYFKHKNLGRYITIEVSKKQILITANHNLQINHERQPFEYCDYEDLLDYRYPEGNYKHLMIHVDTEPRKEILFSYDLPFVCSGKKDFIKLAKIIYK